MVTSDFRPEVEVWPFHACAINICNITVIIGTVRSLWTSLWDRYHVPQRAFLVMIIIIIIKKFWNVKIAFFAKF